MLNHFKDNNTNSDYTGFHYSKVNLKAALEDFLKDEYTTGLKAEFNTMDALINTLRRETITDRKKFKTFQLGILDNTRALGRQGFDLYKIQANDYITGFETADAAFDTTKYIGALGITDEAIKRGTGGESFINILNDNLAAMEQGQKHTLQRYTYGSETGFIGKVTTFTKKDDDLATEGATPRSKWGDGTNAPYVPKTGTNPGKQGAGLRPLSNIVDIKCTNSFSLLPGMQLTLVLCYKDTNNRIIPLPVEEGGDATDIKRNFVTYKIFDKSNLKPGQAHEKLRLVRIQGEFSSTEDDIIGEIIDNDGVRDNEGGHDDGAMLGIFSRQIIQGQIAKEYTGLEDIVITQKNTIFELNREYYESLNCVQSDLEGNLLTESHLRDMADTLAVSGPDSQSINLVCSKHSIISAIEKQLYSVKSYSLDASNAGFNLGRPAIKFDNFELRKDKYARDQHVYMLNTNTIGELVRFDWEWLTSGREGIFERLEGTEIYEAIMIKYADMSIDSWRDHASFINVGDKVKARGSMGEFNINMTNIGELAEQVASLGEQESQ